MVSLSVFAVCTIVGGYLIKMALDLYNKWGRGRWRLVQLVDKIPGPKPIPLFGNSLQFGLDPVTFSFDIERVIRDYGEPNGGVTRFWIGLNPCVLITSPEGAEPLLSSNTELTKSNNYDILRPWIRNGLLVSRDSYWRKRRKLITPTFHYGILENFVKIFNVQAKVLVDQLEGETGKTFNVAPYVKRCALDIVCEAAMSVQIGAQTHHELDYVKAVEDLASIAVRYELSPWLWSSLGFYASGNAHKFNKCLETLKDLSNRVIASRQSELQKKADAANCKISELKQEGGRVAFLDMLLTVAEENKLTHEDIREEVDTFIFEGHDTTGNAMGWALLLLSLSPHIMAKCHHELDEIFGDSDRDCTMEDLKRMEYLERTVKESLRLYPAVPMFARKLQNDLKVLHYVCPAGATVMISPVFVHRDVKHWGPDPELFDPDNFLPEKINTRHPFAYIPFSAGARNCIGQRFALMEEKVVLSTILRQYKLIAVQKRYEDRPLPELILRPTHGFFLKMTKRRTVNNNVIE